MFITNTLNHGKPRLLVTDKRGQRLTLRGTVGNHWKKDFGNFIVWHISPVIIIAFVQALCNQLLL